MVSRLLNFTGTVVKSALSPSFYSSKFNAVVDANRALIKSNSIMPGVYAILIVASVGFSIEYYGKESESEKIYFTSIKLSNIYFLIF
jgi:hypothetical protein